MLTTILAAALMVQSPPPSQVEHEFFQNALDGVSQANFAEWHEKAEAGEVDAQVVVGLAYRDGRGIGKSPKLAAKWLHEAAERGSSHGQLYLAGLFHRGYGVDRDPERAIHWARVSAEHGNVQAQHTMGIEYDLGETVKKDHKESARWYTMAAEQGYTPSQFNLGMAYYLGEGVRRDENAASQWLTKASESGYAVATYYLGRMAADHDEKAAIAEWRLAAEQGYPTAALNLAEVYADEPLSKKLGLGTDLVEACKWFDVAQALDERGRWANFMPDETKRLRRALNKKRPKVLAHLSPEQRVDCARRAESFLERTRPK